jgi:predicted protein tyrosine phosphatase
MKNLVTVKGNGIYAIIGRDEIESYPSYDEPYSYIKEFPKDLCFITISDPSRKNINHNNHFVDTLELKFWDIEEDIGSYKIITNEQAKQIYDFIVKNKDKEFLINCEAGVSRSAGVGLAIEYLLRDKEFYPKWEQFPSKVSQHWRYQPNMTVFNMIISFDEVK